MARQKKPPIAAEILEALHSTSAEDAALAMLLLSAQSRYAAFMQETQQFQAKDQMDCVPLPHLVETGMNAEDFAQEEDLLAWKFAQDAAAYWRQKTEELQRAAGAGETIC